MSPKAAGAHLPPDTSPSCNNRSLALLCVRSATHVSQRQDGSLLSSQRGRLTRFCIQELILAIQPPVPAKEGAKPPLNFSQFQQLASFIDGFSVMTYDFNVYGMPGPNAPVSWVKANLEFFEPAK